MSFDFICLKKSEDLFDEYRENSSPKKSEAKRSDSHKPICPWLRDGRNSNMKVDRDSKFPGPLDYPLLVYPVFYS